MKTLTIASWIAVLTMFAFIGWRLADQFALENVYPRPEPTRYTESAFKALEYQNAENQARRLKAERFIESIAGGNIGK